MNDSITTPSEAKACQWCGADITGTPRYQKFCPGGDCTRLSSNKRKMARWRASNPHKVVECKVCGTAFTQRHHANTLCSEECRLAAARARGREAAARRRATSAFSTPAKRVNHQVSCAMYKALTRGKQGRAWTALVPYTLVELMAHLESRFLPGMSWDNYGEWHIDHRIPKSVYTYTSPTDAAFLDCWSLDNLQPMWATENRRKGNRYVA